MLSGATLKHGLLTVYCSGSFGGDAERVALVTDGGQDVNVLFFHTAQGGSPYPALAFPGKRITRIRVLGGDGGETILLGDTHTPNLTDVMIIGGSGNDTLSDQTNAHRYNRAERVSVVGGDGNDTLEGGIHTFSMDGGAGDDVLYGGADGATLNGGDGSDVVSANVPSVSYALLHNGTLYEAHGSLLLNGGAGDDYVIGNNFHTFGRSDSLTGGDGNDEFFYDYGTDQVLDFGNGSDIDETLNTFTPPAAVTQTARLSVNVDGTSGLPTSTIGDIFPLNGRVRVSDANGTITMQGPAGSEFLLGDLLNAAGYPVDKLGIPVFVTLRVNGFVSSLTGNQIAGYRINNGDVIQLDFP